MIGGGLALNDTGFILIQATCPTSSLSQSVTLFLSLGVKVCCGVTNKKEKDRVYKRSGQLRSEGPRVTRALLMS